MVQIRTPQPGSPEAVARQNQAAAERILDEAPDWAQQARVDPYNGKVTHYIDLAGNAVEPETDRFGGFSVNGYPARVPAQYLPPGALDPQPTPAPGSGPPTVADDVINQVDLARMRIVRDLKREPQEPAQPRRLTLAQRVQQGFQSRREVPTTSVEIPEPSRARQELGRFQSDRQERQDFKVSSPVPAAQPTAKQKAQQALQQKLASRGLDGVDAPTSDPSLDR